MAVLDWLQQMLGGGDPSDSGLAYASSATAPDALGALQSYLGDVGSGKIAAGGALAQNYYDPNRSFAQNALDPRAIEQATDVAFGIGPGAIRATPKSYRLEPAKADDVGYPYGGPGPGGNVYKIVGPEGHTGILQVRTQGDTAVVDDIFDIAGGRNFLGPRAVRGLLDQFLAENPGIKRIAGERVSGARFGGETVPAGEGVDMTVDMLRRLRGLSE